MQIVSYIGVGLCAYFLSPMLGFCLTWMCVGLMCAITLAKFIMYIRIVSGKCRFLEVIWLLSCSAYSSTQTLTPEVRGLKKTPLCLLCNSWTSEKPQYLPWKIDGYYHRTFLFEALISVKPHTFKSIVCHVFKTFLSLI